MSDAAGRRIRTAGAVFLLAAGALLAPPPAAPQTPSEDDLIRQIKSSAFDEKWEEVLAGCDRLIAAYPRSEFLPRAMHSRAKALHHLPGREEEAVAAYGALIERFPGETVLREDAAIGRMSLAKSLWLRGRKEHVSVLMQGLEEKGYPRIYAAVQISHLDNRPARSRALPVLKDCSLNERDSEVRNECTLAILRIDPAAVPAPPTVGTTSAAPAPERPSGGEPRLIRLEVREKGTDKLRVAVNLPIAFAEALLGALSEYEHGQVVEELKRRNIDLDNIWKSLKTMGAQTLVQVETDEVNVRIWLE